MQFPTLQSAKDRANEINSGAKAAREALARGEGDDVHAAARKARAGTHVTNGRKRFVVHITGGPEGAVTEA